MKRASYAPTVRVIREREACSQARPISSHLDYTMPGLGETLILLLKQQNIRTQKNDNTIENNTIEYIRIHNLTTNNEGVQCTMELTP